MISIENLRFRYPQGEFHLEISDFTVKQGSSVALVGPSGSGKTTLLNLIAGITVPAAGRVIIDKVEVTSLSEAERRDFRACRIGMVFQEFELLDHLNVMDNILLIYRISPALKIDNEVRARAARLLQEVGMGDKSNRFVRRLSQGERQRVAICRALLTRPYLLLCDEPTGNLDPSNKGHILDILTNYVKRHDATLVSVTHEQEILERFDSVVNFDSLQRRGEVAT